MTTTLRSALGLLLAWSIALLLGACGAFDPSTSGTGSNAGSVAYATGDYKIGPEDELEIMVWRNADLSKIVTVRPDGKISLPLVGDVSAMGLSADQLAKEIATKLKQFKETPTVSVVVKQVNSYGVYVLGEVTKPGRYQLKTFTTVLQSVSAAGGFTMFARKKMMFVLRKSPETGLETRINVNYDEIVSGSDTAKNIILIPGDTVVVP